MSDQQLIDKAYVASYDKLIALTMLLDEGSEAKRRALEAIGELAFSFKHYGEESK
jgi:hypothetical protein